ncbi:molybdopterin-guanine dinucleotide biosynthesis protein MobA [Cellulomonas bogoriensis 69B4 = DSM 16987]|uniref:Molybdopterin-guanine dinucleotide biosynthesis protein MobA n=1 Tax=Cellulomonas bogoriensis 69B4 = DSM 16987 TaxID=1386082 RepID=A0A0A0C234_9CELL|nr:molybdopterin-guanine dinucleotide biosynthesis protein MobA [Cellulomonas bogoriensis 69B4 = DSM 16987]
MGGDLYRWVAHLADELGVHPDAVDVEAVLDLARETAHGVARPAVPLTSYLTGIAVGAGAGDREAFDRVSAHVNRLLEQWRTPS